MVKKYFLLVVAILMGSMTTVEAQTGSGPLRIVDTRPDVVVIRRSPCLEEMLLVEEVEGDEENWDWTERIVLKKEDGILSVDLFNMYGGCGGSDYRVESTVSEGYEGTPSNVTINISGNSNVYYEGEGNPGISPTCFCTYNLSFVVRGLEDNTFYLKCWWYDGMVQLTEGEPLEVRYEPKDISVDGLSYRVLRVTHEATLLNCNPCDGEFSIPSEISYEGETYTVKYLGYNAFWGRQQDLKKVIVPSTIEDLCLLDDANSFNDCVSLESIEVEEDNPVYRSVDGVLYTKDMTKLLAYPAASTRNAYTVPESVFQIYGNAFANSQHLEKVIIPDNVTVLGYAAFANCKNLEEVRLSSNLNLLTMYLFKNCERLKSVEIPQGIAAIYDGVFEGCSSMTKISLPESVELVSSSCFKNCTSLKEVTLSPKLQSLSDDMFSGCTSLISVNLPNNLTLIAPSAFYNCTALRTLNIPEKVYYVGYEAFRNCTALRMLDLPEKIRYIGKGAFWGCKFNALCIRGIIIRSWLDGEIFRGMDTETKVYVQPSEVGKYQTIYGGPVYPLPNTNETTGISDITPTTGTASTLHDLQGRRLTDTPQSGLYIRNGKKYVVK